MDEVEWEQATVAVRKKALTARRWEEIKLETPEKITF